MLPKTANKVRGNALAITVIMSIVLALLTSSLILSVFYLRNSQKRFELESRLNANLESATNNILADSSLALDGSTEQTDLFGLGKDSVIVKDGLWGLFGVASVKAHHGLLEKKRTFFYGCVLPESMSGCLYIANHNRPLSIVGNTKLSGDAYLSEAGIKAAYINQRGYNSQALIDGKIKKSEAHIPALHADVRSYLLNLFAVAEGNENGFETLSDTINQSFDQATVFMRNSGPVNLEGKALKGRIIVQSDSSIEVEADNYFENILLVAPVIRFKEGFRGTVQAFASDSLFVAENCEFDYPSVLSLIKKNTANVSPVLQVEENCLINGFIFSFSTADDKYKTMVNLKRNTLVTGIVYCEGYLSLQANVSGSVLTDYFLYRSPSTVFENYLVDVEINRQTLSPYFQGSIFFESTNVRKIIQWVQ